MDFSEIDRVYNSLLNNFKRLKEEADFIITKSTEKIKQP